MSLKKYPLDQQLLFASARGDLHEVLKLLKDGATVAVNKHGRTALHIASHRGYLDIVRSLLQAGCDPDIQDDNGDTALHRAVTSGYDKIVERLLDEACSVDQQNHLGDTALHEASRCGHSNIVKTLIKANANVQCKNKNFDVPLHMACANGHATSVQQLLHSLSSVSPANKQTDTPLHLAVRFGHSTCTRLLVGANCDLNAQNNFGNTALHLATATRRRKLVRILLDADAETQLLNRDGKSSIDLAKEMENGELVLMLISGARPPPRRRSRPSLKSFPSKHRSRSDPRHTARIKSSSEECNASLSLKRSPSKTKVKKKQHRPVPESHRYHKRAPKPAHNPRKESAPRMTLEEHQRNLVVNPYVVPQLYALHRDENGEIQQSAILDRLPNPTPRVVDQLHRSIQNVNQQWKHSLDEATCSLAKRMEEIEHETAHQIRSLDRLTSERIQAERTLCLHRIDQRATFDRAMSEGKIMDKLQRWMENRMGQKQINPMNQSVSIDVPITEHRLRGRQEDHGFLVRSMTAENKPITLNNCITESEVRSLDSGVGGTPAGKIPDPLMFKPDHGDFEESSCSSHTACNVDHFHQLSHPGTSTSNNRLRPIQTDPATSETFWHSTPYNSHQAGEHSSFHRAFDSLHNPVRGVSGQQNTASYKNFTSGRYYPSAQEELYARVLESNLRDQHGLCSPWIQEEQDDIEFTEELQNLSLTTSHAV